MKKSKAESIIHQYSIAKEKLDKLILDEVNYCEKLKKLEEPRGTITDQIYQNRVEVDKLQIQIEELTDKKLVFAGKIEKLKAIMANAPIEITNAQKNLSRVQALLNPARAQVAKWEKDINEAKATLKQIADTELARAGLEKDVKDGLETRVDKIVTDQVMSDYKTEYFKATGHHPTDDEVAEQKARFRRQALESILEGQSLETYIKYALGLRKKEEDRLYRHDTMGDKVEGSLRGFEQLRAQEGIEEEKRNRRREQL